VKRSNTLPPKSPGSHPGDFFPGLDQKGVRISLELKKPFCAVINRQRDNWTALAR
jgi:hypothetical protein